MTPRQAAQSAIIYRYFDKVSISLSDLQTVYLAPDMAIDIANALQATANSCKVEEFKNSKQTHTLTHKPNT